MKTHRFTTTLVLVLVCCVQAEEHNGKDAPETDLLREHKGKYATVTDLLTTNIATPSKVPSTPAEIRDARQSGYALWRTFDRLRLGERQIAVRVWTLAMFSWPGSQPQIIQVVDTKGIVLAARLVGGEPIMYDAWAAVHGKFVFVYIKCEHRHRKSPGVYIYRVDESLTITDQGVYYDKQDLEQERKHRQEIESRSSLHEIEGVKSRPDAPTRKPVDSQH